MPYLEPGEQIQAVFTAQSGLKPTRIVSNSVLGPKEPIRYVIVVVTDRAIVVLDAGAVRPHFPKSVLARLPRATRLDEPSGSWGTIQLNRQYWVGKRYREDVMAANQLLHSTNPSDPPPSAPPPP